MELPAVFLLYDSAFWSSAYILFLFAVCAWNGGGFYIEVFGRKYVHITITYPQHSFFASNRFERELEALRKELAEVTARSERSSPTLGPQSDDDLSNSAGSPRVLSPIVAAVDPQDVIPPMNGDAR